LIAPDDHPFYVLFLDIDPAKIDVNVHPSKHEIKFLDERIIYQYIRVATRHALGQYVPLSLDFEATDKGLSHSIGTSGYKSAPQTPLHYNSTSQQSPHASPVGTSQDWRKLYEGFRPTATDDQALVISSNMDDHPGNSTNESVFSVAAESSPKLPYQLHLTYIISSITSGFLLIDQEAAHQRILYERSVRHFSGKAAPSQRSLFPTTLQVSGSDYALLTQMIPDFQQLGFDLEPFGTNSFIVHGMPMDWKESDSVQGFIESLLRHFIEESDQKTNPRLHMAKYFARYQSIKSGQKLTIEEMQYLIDQLFACEDAAWGVFGGKCYTTVGLDEVRKRLV
jgi:DNA mismatch repair protein MutL